MGISLSQGPYLHKEKHNNRLNTDIQVSSGIRTQESHLLNRQRQFMPQTSRPLLSAIAYISCRKWKQRVGFHGAVVERRKNYNFYLHHYIWIKNPGSRFRNGSPLDRHTKEQISKTSVVTVDLEAPVPTTHWFPGCLNKGRISVSCID
jgi:hypothetical protein